MIGIFTYVIKKERCQLKAPRERETIFDKFINDTVNILVGNHDMFKLAQTK